MATLTLTPELRPVTRRYLLSAAPVAAIALAIPGQASAKTSDIAGWNRAKADYASACTAESDAIDCQTVAEETLLQFWHTAPEGTATYTANGAIYDNGAIVMQPFEHTVQLDRHTIKQYQPDDVRQSPEFRAFCDRVEAWRNDPAHLAAQSAFDAADAATSEAMNAKIAAWGALVDFPLSDPATIADKMAIALPYVDGCGEWAERLLVALQADLERVMA